mmetsp:Transcript_92573/g.299320  ORF Transcript_92573/g.299320 Transcript_92573/m.299320 type:complete len:352 (-) Transcript_92573:1644-2699(-)
MALPGPVLHSRRDDEEPLRELGGRGAHRRREGGLRKVGGGLLVLLGQEVRAEDHCRCRDRDARAHVARVHRVLGSQPRLHADEVPRRLFSGRQRHLDAVRRHEQHFRRGPPHGCDVRLEGHDGGPLGGPRARQVLEGQQLRRDHGVLRRRRRHGHPPHHHLGHEVPREAGDHGLLLDGGHQPRWRQVPAEPGNREVFQVHGWHQGHRGQRRDRGHHSRSDVLHRHGGHVGDLRLEEGCRTHLQVFDDWHERGDRYRGAGPLRLPLPRLRRHQGPGRLREVRRLDPRRRALRDPDARLGPLGRHRGLLQGDVPRGRAGSGGAIEPQLLDRQGLGPGQGRGRLLRGGEDLAGR